MSQARLYPEYCFVADKSLYEIGLQHEEVMKPYIDSIMPIKIIFWNVQTSGCLVTSTIIPEQISLLDKRLDSPVLFDNSEELYINNVIEDFKQEYDDLTTDFCLAFERTATEGELEMIEEEGNLLL